MILLVHCMYTSKTKKNNTGSDQCNTHSGPSRSFHSMVVEVVQRGPPTCTRKITRTPIVARRRVGKKHVLLADMHRVMAQSTHGDAFVVVVGHGVAEKKIVGHGAHGQRVHTNAMAVATACVGNNDLPQHREQREDETQ